MKVIITIISLLAIIFAYTIIGTSGNVTKIKQIVPLEMSKRNWKILRQGRWEYGSWNHHGGKVWYHVCNIDNPSIQYRVFVTMWNGELQWYYGKPEQLFRLDITQK